MRRSNSSTVTFKLGEILSLVITIMSLFRNDSDMLAAGVMGLVLLPLGYRALYHESMFEILSTIIQETSTSIRVGNFRKKHAADYQALNDETNKLINKIGQGSVEELSISQLVTYLIDFQKLTDTTDDELKDKACDLYKAQKKLVNKQKMDLRIFEIECKQIIAKFDRIHFINSYLNVSNNLVNSIKEKYFEERCSKYLAKYKDDEIHKKATDFLLNKSRNTISINTIYEFYKLEYFKKYYRYDYYSSKDYFEDKFRAFIDNLLADGYISSYQKADLFSYSLYYILGTCDSPDYYYYLEYSSRRFKEACEDKNKTYDYHADDFWLDQVETYWVDYAKLIKTSCPVGIDDNLASEFVRILVVNDYKGIAFADGMFIEFCDKHLSGKDDNGTILYYFCKLLYINKAMYKEDYFEYFSAPYKDVTPEGFPSYKEFVNNIYREQMEEQKKKRENSYYYKYCQKNSGKK